MAPGSTSFTVLRWGLTVDWSGRRSWRLQLIMRRNLKLSGLPQRADSIKISHSGPVMADPTAPDTNEGLPSPPGGLIDPCAGAVCFRVPNVISTIATQEVRLSDLSIETISSWIPDRSFVPKFSPERSQ